MEEVQAQLPDDMNQQNNDKNFYQKSNENLHRDAIRSQEGHLWALKKKLCNFSKTKNELKGEG